MCRGIIRTVHNLVAHRWLMLIFWSIYLYFFFLSSFFYFFV